MAKFIVQLRRGTKEEWETVGKDIVPLEGELVLEYDNGVPRLKIGNGKDLYKDLPYMSVDSFISPTHSKINLYSTLWEPNPDGPGYIQYITDQLAGKITLKSQVDLQPTPAQLDAFKQKDVAFTAINEDGNVYVCATGVCPKQDYEGIQISITEVVIDG